jgi:ketosteroid isomerase-like protein
MCAITACVQDAWSYLPTKSENSEQPPVRQGSVAPIWVGSAAMLHRLITAAMAALLAPQAAAECPRDAAAIIELDRQYQDAVFRNDSGAIERLLPEDFALVTGRGKPVRKADLVKEARTQAARYERQHDTQQSVRFIGEIAVISALLHAKGREGRKPFDYRLWFSDVYLCTPEGWRYSFAQSSIPLPE